MLLHINNSGVGAVRVQRVPEDYLEELPVSKQQKALM